jgi:hypothetical protein
MEKELIKQAVKEAFKEELQQFYIDRETHYQHHQFIADWIESVKQCKSVVLKTIYTIIVVGALGLLALGFITKYKG